MEVYKQIKKDMGYCVMLGLVFYFLMMVFDIGKDDTDGEKRSGMKPMIDAKTGCQYLTANGGITPRLDKTGKQICGV